MAISKCIYNLNLKCHSAAKKLAFEWNSCFLSFWLVFFSFFWLGFCASRFVSDHHRSWHVANAFVLVDGCRERVSAMRICKIEVVDLTNPPQTDEDK